MIEDNVSILHDINQKIPFVFCEWDFDYRKDQFTSGVAKLLPTGGGWRGFMEICPTPHNSYLLY